MSNKKFSLGWIILVGLLVGGLVVYALSRLIKKWFPQDQETDLEPMETVTSQNDPEKDKRIIDAYTTISNAIKQHSGEFDNNKALLLTAQAAHESGAFSSPLYLSNNNAFGMRHPLKRPTTSIGDKNNYASYNSLFDSVEDRLLWGDYVNEVWPADYKSFSKFLKDKAYYEDSQFNYTNAIKSWSAQIQNLLSRG